MPRPVQVISDQQFRSDVSQALAAVLTKIPHAKVPAAGLTVAMADGKLQAYLLVAPLNQDAQPSALPAALPATPAHHLSSLEAAVLNAATDAPQSCKAIARAVSRSLARVREAVARLCDLGLLERTSRFGIRRST